MGPGFLLVLGWLAVVGGLMVLLTGLTAVLALGARFRPLRRAALMAWSAAVTALLLGIGLVAVVPNLWSFLQPFGSANQDGEGPWVAMALLGSAGAIAALPALALSTYLITFFRVRSRHRDRPIPASPPPVPVA